MAEGMDTVNVVVEYGRGRAGGVGWGELI